MKKRILYIVPQTKNFGTKILAWILAFCLFEKIDLSTEEASIMRLLPERIKQSDDQKSLKEMRSHFIVTVGDTFFKKHPTSVRQKFEEILPAFTIIEATRPDPPKGKTKLYRLHQRMGTLIKWRILTNHG